MMRSFEYNNRRYKSPDHVAMAGSQLRKRGKLHFATGLLEAGLAHYGTAPESSSIKLSLGTCYRAAGQSHKALSLLTDVVHAQPGNVFAHIELTKIYTAKGDYDLARTHGRAVLDTHPYNAHAMLALVQVESLSGKKKLAESIFARMEALDPRAPGHRKMLEIAENFVRQKSLLTNTAVAEDEANRRAFRTRDSEAAIMEVVHIPNPPFQLKLSADLRKKRQSADTVDGMHHQETGEFDMGTAAAAFETAAEGLPAPGAQHPFTQAPAQGLNASMK